MKLHYLWNIDPGYFHLKRALKTIAAILLTLWFVQDEDLLTQMMASLATGFSMQGIVAKAFSSRIKQVLSLNLAYFGVFNLGLLVRESLGFRSLLLIVVGFLANYMRQFGLQNSVAPMMGWTLCFFATTLPFISATEAWRHIDALALGLGVSAVMTLAIFPENYPRLFVSNTNRLFSLMAQGMHELRKEMLSVSIYSKFNDERLEKIAKQLTQLLESNQAIEQSDVFSEDAFYVSSQLIHEYALVHVYRMMIDAYRILIRHEQKLSFSTCLTLNRVYRQFEFLLASLQMQKNCSVISKYSNSIQNLKIRPLNNIELKEPAMILVILNLKLSFILLEQHIDLLLRGANEV